MASLTVAAVRARIHAALGEPAAVANGRFDLRAATERRGSPFSAWAGRSSPRLRAPALAAMTAIVLAAVSVATAIQLRDHGTSLGPGATSPSQGASGGGLPAGGSPGPSSAASGAPVPAGFAPLSASFVSPTDAFVLGEAACGSGFCTQLAVTTNGGWSWHAQNGPPVPLSQLTRMRFASASIGYAWGPNRLETTTDGGRSWTSAGYPGQGAGAVLDDLQTRSGQVLVLTSSADGTVLVSRSPVASLSWSAIPGSSLPAPALGTPQLSIDAADGYVLDDEVLAGGPLTGSWTSHPAPCSAGLQASERFAAYSPHSLFLACSGVGPAATASTWFGIDGATTFQPTAQEGGPTPAGRGQVEEVATAGSSTAYVVTGGTGALVSVLNGTAWQPVFGPIGDGQPVSDFGFTNAAQGLLVLGEPEGKTGPGDGLYLTRDGGSTWQLIDFSVSSLPSRCRAAGLQVSVGQTVTALGNTATAVILRTGGAPCSLSGYPGVTVQGAGGSPSAVARWAAFSYLVEQRPLLPVVLSPEHPATFFLSDTDSPTGGATTCPTITRLIVYAPGSYHTITATTKLTLCALPPTVSPVYPGVQGPGLG